MSDDLAEAIAVAKRRLEEMLRRVPAKVRNGSYNTAVDYKKAVMSARKQLANKSPRYASLQASVNELQIFED